MNPPVSNNTTNEILTAIPHRPPMLLLDAIVERAENRIVCSKTFAESDFFVQGHFPGRPLVPGVILCECCLQAGAVLVADHAQVAAGLVPVATRMDGVKFKKMVHPGDTISIEVTLNESVSKAFYLTGKVLVEDKLAARLDFAVSVAEPS